MAENEQTPKKRNLLSKLVQSPEGKMAMVQAGLALLSPQNPNSSTVSQFGNALGQGLNYYTRAQGDIRAQEQQRTENQMAQEGMDMERQGLESDLQTAEAQRGVMGAQQNYYNARASAASSPTPPTAQNMTENPVYQSLLDNELAINPQSPNLLKVQLQFRTLQGGGQPGDVIAADGGQVLQLQRDPETGAPMVDPSGGVVFISHPDGNPIVQPIEWAARISPDVARMVEEQNMPDPSPTGRALGPGQYGLMPGVKQLSDMFTGGGQ